jgi:hypothetical protein
MDDQAGPPEIATGPADVQRDSALGVLGGGAVE